MSACQVIAKSKDYIIFNEKRGEGTFGAVHIGTTTKDSNVQLCFKMLKQQSKQVGMLMVSNVREATFLSQMSSWDKRTSTVVTIYDILAGDQFQVINSQYQELFQSLVIVMPKFQTDLANALGHPAILDFNPKQAFLFQQRIMNSVLLLHKQGYAHRDLKPNNIVLSDHWRLYLIDFGSVQFLSEQQDEQPTQHDDVSESEPIQMQQKLDDKFQIVSHGVGTLWWRPPEQTFSNSQFKQEIVNNNISYQETFKIKSCLADGRYSDSFVVGCMMLELCLGLQIFRTESSDDRAGKGQLEAIHCYADPTLLTPAYKRMIQYNIDVAEFLKMYIKLNNCSDSLTFENIEKGNSNSLGFRVLIQKMLVIRFAKVYKDGTMIKISITEEELRYIAKMVGPIEALMNLHSIDRKIISEIQIDKDENYRNDQWELQQYFNQRPIQTSERYDRSRSIFIKNLNLLGRDIRSDIWWCPWRETHEVRNQEIDIFVKTLEILGQQQ